ncbi:cytochrome P450 [Streptomyces sp. NPDC058239]|uniref:cytochrome P450 n=1 Tax=unclassified Streptomyces TaxID=2593676 RepID=UPI0036502E19
MSETAPEPTAAATEVRRYPFGETLRLDLHPLFAQLRREEPVSRVQLPFGGQGWLVTRYEDARLVFTDPRFSRAGTADREDVPRIMPQPLSANEIASMDPPDHTRLRKLVAKAFTSRRVEQLRPRAQQIVDERLSAIEKAGPVADLVRDLALPLPVTVICEMLGVPPQDQHRFQDFSHAVLSVSPESIHLFKEALSALEAYLAEVVEERRTQPTDDLLGALVAARDNEDRLSEEELVKLGVALLIAGHQTTANQIANFLYVLLTEPRHWMLLHQRPDLVPGAIEELLRYIPLGLGGGFARIATEDVRVGDVTVRTGESVIVSSQAANRDEAVFDNSEELDLTRAHNPHMAFGYGIHHCLGAHLARLELQIVLGSVLRRFPTLRLAVPADEVPWKTGLSVRGPEALPVSW